MEYSNRNKTKVKHRRTDAVLVGAADLSAIGSRMRELRGNIQQEDLARYLQISQGQLSKIERGRVAPTVEVLLRMSKRFGKSVDWMLNGSEQ